MANTSLKPNTGKIICSINFWQKVTDGEHISFALSFLPFVRLRSVMCSWPIGTIIWSLQEDPVCNADNTVPFWAFQLYCPEHTTVASTHSPARAHNIFHCSFYSSFCLITDERVSCENAFISHLNHEGAFSLLYIGLWEAAVVKRKANKRSVQLRF